MAALSKQTNLAVNSNKSQIYFEDATNPLSYNFKTDQWSLLTDYAGIGFYSVLSGVNIGLVRTSGTAVDLQQPDTSDPAAQAIITTGENAFSDGSRRMITGVRPLLTGASANVSIVSRDTLNPSTRTNLCLQSEALGTTWTAEDVTITDNAVAAPDGPTTADKIVENSDSDDHLISQTISHTSGAQLTFSAFGKAAERTWIRLQASTGGGVASWFDISNGVLGAGGGVSPNVDPTFRTIEVDNNGFFRCSITWTATGQSSSSVRIYLAEDDNSESYVGDGSSGAYVWGSQLEEAAAPSGYIKTTTVAATSSLTTSTESSVNARSGIAPFRDESRYHRVKFRVAGGFTTILGADIEFEQSGEI
jgi:hypothetical protein